MIEHSKFHVGADVSEYVARAVDARVRDEGTSRRFMVESGLCMFLGLPLPAEHKTRKKKKNKWLR